jgi:hypothetical protein
MLLYLVHLQKVMDLQVQSFLRRFPAKNGGHKILWVRREDRQGAVDESSIR